MPPSDPSLPGGPPCGQMTWRPLPNFPGGGYCAPNCFKENENYPGEGEQRYVPDIRRETWPEECLCDDLTCEKCYTDIFTGKGPGGEPCSNDAICVKWPDQTQIPWSPLLVGITYSSGSNPTKTLGNASKLPWFSYEIIPGLTRSWCPWYVPFTTFYNCPPQEVDTWTMGITFYNKAIESKQIFSTLSTPPILPANILPKCDKDNNYCWTGHSDFVMRNGLSDNMRLGVDDQQRWFTSISSYGTKTLVNRNGVFYGNSERGYGSAHTQGITFSVSFNENTINAASLSFTDIVSGTEFAAVGPSGPMGLSVLASPYFMDGNKSNSGLGWPFSGPTGEGDVFASVWQNYSGYTEYKPYGLDYYSVLPKGSTVEVLRNYPNYRDGVFGERPDLILFRLANDIYPNSWMLGFSGCTAPFLANNRIEGQTACIIDPVNCDPKYTPSLVYYNQVAVGARHALVTMGEYVIGPDTSPIKTFPYLIQFSGQEFGRIDQKANWSTMKFNLTPQGGVYQTRKLFNNNPIFGIVTGISYSNQKDKLYKHGISGETSITQEWDLENDSCSFKDGNVINPLLCGFGLTSCFKYGITLGHEDHPIWNRGVDDIPYVSVISAFHICSRLYPSTAEADKCSWDWISAGNTGESCAILRCELNNDILERHVICWGNRYDQPPNSEYKTATGIPTEAWELGMGNQIVQSEEGGYKERNCKDNSFTNTYHPCQIDIKGSSPVIYYRSYPYDLVGHRGSAQSWDPNGQTLLNTYNIRGKTKYFNNTSCPVNHNKELERLCTTGIIFDGACGLPDGPCEGDRRCCTPNPITGKVDCSIKTMTDCYNGGGAPGDLSPSVGACDLDPIEPQGLSLTDPTGPAFDASGPVGDHVRRGGSWKSGYQFKKTASYRSIPGGHGNLGPNNVSNEIGFRVARTASDSQPSYTILQPNPDPAVVTDAKLRAAITATGFPWKVRDNGTNIEMMLVPAGTFRMGCSALAEVNSVYPSENAFAKGCYYGVEEMPFHQVTLTKSFYIGRYAVTQAQWQAKMGSNPSACHPPNGTLVGGAIQPCPTLDTTRPVERVSWNMVAGTNQTPPSFMSVTGLRLPTEAEWEYAYRAGTTTAFHSFPGYANGTNDDTLLGNIAWNSGNNGDPGSSTYGTKPVGGKFANALGLHDMSGNVWEWCQDLDGGYSSEAQTNPIGPATGSSRVLRGGTWNENSYYCRASGRYSTSPDSTYYYYGFRVVRTP